METPQILYGLEIPKITDDNFLDCVNQMTFLSSVIYGYGPTNGSSNTDWVAAPYKNITTQKREDAILWLNRTFAGVTREPGFTDSMTNQQIIDEMTAHGHIWDHGTKHWRDHALEQRIREAVHAGYPTDWIWGDS